MTDINKLTIFVPMARDKELHNKQAKEIRTYFEILDTLKEYGVKKHTTAWCIAKTGFRFNLRPKTIETYIYS